MDLFVLIMLNNILVISVAEDCTLSHLYGCLESLQMIGSSLEKIATKNELIDVCRQLKSGVQCVDNHLSTCFTSNQKRVFDDVVASARIFLKDLCVEGPVQNEYLQFAECYENISLTQEGTCALTYKDLMMLSDIPNKHKDAERNLWKTCCAFEEFIFCKYKLANEYCGPDAADFLQHHINRISSPLLQELCVQYSVKDDCTSMSPTRTTFILPVTSMDAVFFLGLLWLFRFGYPN